MCNCWRKIALLWREIVSVEDAHVQKKRKNSKEKKRQQQIRSDCRIVQYSFIRIKMSNV